MGMRITSTYRTTGRLRTYCLFKNPKAFKSEFSFGIASFCCFLKNHLEQGGRADLLPTVLDALWLRASENHRPGKFWHGKQSSKIKKAVDPDWRSVLWSSAMMLRMREVQNNSLIPFQAIENPEARQGYRTNQHAEKTINHGAWCPHRPMSCIILKRGNTSWLITGYISINWTSRIELTRKEIKSPSRLIAGWLEDIVSGVFVQIANFKAPAIRHSSPHPYTRLLVYCFWILSVDASSHSKVPSKLAK